MTVKRGRETICQIGKGENNRFGVAEATRVRKKRKATPGPYLIRLELLGDRVPSFEKFPYCLPALRDLDR